MSGNEDSLDAIRAELTDGDAVGVTKGPDDSSADAGGFRDPTRNPASSKTGPALDAGVGGGGGDNTGTDTGTEPTRNPATSKTGPALDAGDTGTDTKPVKSGAGEAVSSIDVGGDSQGADGSGVPDAPADGGADGDNTTAAKRRVERAFANAQTAPITADKVVDASRQGVRAAQQQVVDPVADFVGEAGGQIQRALAPGTSIADAAVQEQADKPGEANVLEGASESVTRGFGSAAAASTVGAPALAETVVNTGRGAAEFAASNPLQESAAAAADVTADFVASEANRAINNPGRFVGEALFGASVGRAASTALPESVKSGRTGQVFRAADPDPTKVLDAGRAINRRIGGDGGPDPLPGPDLGTEGTGPILDAETVDEATGTTGPSTTQRVRGEAERILGMSPGRGAPELVDDDARIGPSGDLIQRPRGGDDAGRIDDFGGDGPTDPEFSRDEILEGSPRDQISDDIFDRQQRANQIDADPDPDSPFGDRPGAGRDRGGGFDSDPDPDPELDPETRGRLGEIIGGISTPGVDADTDQTPRQEQPPLTDTPPLVVPRQDPRQEPRITPEAPPRDTPETDTPPNRTERDNPPEQNEPPFQSDRDNDPDPDPDPPFDPNPDPDPEFFPEEERGDDENGGGLVATSDTFSSGILSADDVLEGQ